MCAAITCFKGLNTQNHFYSCSAWFFQCKGKSQIKSMREQSTEELI